MSEGNRPVYCEQCGSLAEAGDRFCGVCGAGITPNAQDATTREIPTRVQPPRSGTEDQVTSTRNNRAFLIAGVLGVVLLLLVGGGALAFIGLGSATGLLGGADPKPVLPANTRETTASLPEPTREQTRSSITSLPESTREQSRSSIGSTEPRITSPGSTDPNTGETSLDQAAGDYYRAAGAQQWSYTYNHLDSQTRNMFTEEEWYRRNQWFWDRNTIVYHILSTSVVDSSGEPIAEVKVRLTPEYGSAWTRTTYFVKEGGEWLHRFSQEETDLFMPDATFEEFVKAQTSTSSEGTPGPAPKSGLLRFDGSWFVHGTQMNIVSDATSSQIANVGPCITSIDYKGPMCNQINLIEFSEAPASGIVVV